MRLGGMVLLLVLWSAVLSYGGQQPNASCESAPDCARMAGEAITRSEFELAHDLAWRAVQLGRPNDRRLMYLLARAQSLSGRPHDALVMLRRLADLGFRAEEVETHEDFRRVRALPSWPEALAAIRADAPEATPAPDTGTAPNTPGAPDAPDAPVAPEAPVAPVSPAAPVARTAPDAPNAPAAPSAPEPVAPVSPGAPVARTAPDAPNAPAAPTAPGSGLPIPVAPLALAYDSVSDRFVVIDETSDTLKVVDERTGHIIDLVSRGWSGATRAAAVAIDPRRGELWAAGVDMTSAAPQSTLFKLQLVSGRLLQTIPLPQDAGPTRIIDLVVGRDTLFLLDAIGRRVFSLNVEGKSPRVASNLVSLGEPISIAAASDTILYVAHADGLARIDLAAPARLPIPVPAAADLGDIQSISWHDGSLFAIQRSGAGHVAARIRLNARGTTARAIEPLGPAAAAAAAVYGGVFYYVAPDSERGMVLRGTKPQ